MSLRNGDHYTKEVEVQSHCFILPPSYIQCPLHTHITPTFFTSRGVHCGAFSGFQQTNRINSKPCSRGFRLSLRIRFLPLGTQQQHLGIYPATLLKAHICLLKRRSLGLVCSEPFLVLDKNYRCCANLYHTICRDVTATTTYSQR